MTTEVSNPDEISLKEENRRLREEIEHLYEIIEQAGIELETISF